MDRNHLNNSERGPTKDHSCEDQIPTSGLGDVVLRLWTDGQTDDDDDGRTVGDHNSSP